MTLDKAALLTRRLGEVEHEIPGFGTVRVRGMSREELLEWRSLDDVIGDRKVLAACLLDPVLTEDEVETWQKHSSPLEIQGVLNAIRDLSGLGEGATKSGVSGVRERPGT